MLSNQQKLSTFQNTKISLIDLQRNPLKQWTDIMIHTWWLVNEWTNTMTCYFGPFDEISNKKLNESNAKKMTVFLSM